jgi:hypothetical protein
MSSISVRGGAASPERKWFSKRLCIYYHELQVNNNFSGTFSGLIGLDPWWHPYLPCRDCFAGMEDLSRAMCNKSTTALETAAAGGIEPRRTGPHGHSG